MFKIVGATPFVVAAVAACGGGPDSMEGSGKAPPAPTHSPQPADPALASPSGPESIAVAAVRIAALSPLARPSACVMLDKAGSVIAMDEFECLAVGPNEFCHDDCGAWSYCAGCLMFLDRTSVGRWVLEARPGAATCSAFAGSYELGDAAKDCTSVPPTAPTPTRTSRGELVESLAASARASVCVTTDAAGAITHVDEFACSTATWMHDCAPNDCRWLQCGACLLRVESAGDGHRRLKARLGTSPCEALAGTYDVDDDAACW